MGDPGDEADHHGNLQFLRHLEGLVHHVVAFLLIPGLEAGNQGETRVVAAVLFVLAGVHAGIVGDGDDQAAVRARHGRVHEGVRRHVQTDVLHADERPAPGPGHAQGLLVGDLFVGRPEGMHISAFLRPPLDELEDLGRRCSGIGVNPADPGIDGTEAHGLITQEYFL